ncbi:MAG: MCE family protein [Prolixibacteraceae bacterium]|nr:MCE family protein [Prolixibacteraceae bacterium]
MKISKYAKLGLLIVFTISILIWGLSYLKGHDFFKSISYYYIIYDRVEGLVESDAVTLNGYQVGQVKSLKFVDDGSGNLLVTISIEGDLKIPVNSVARIVSSDIMGNKSIKLIFNPNTEVYSTNDTIPGAVESDLKEQVSLQVLPLKTKAEQLLATIDSAITVLTVIFNEDARDNLSESFRNINFTIANIEETSKKLKELIDRESENVSSVIGNLNQVSESFSNKSGDFENIITKLSSVSDSLAAIPFSPLIASVSNATKGIEEILLKLKSEQGTAGLLINSPDLYDNLVGLSEDLDKLMRDIRLNPKRYVSFSAFDLGKEVYITASPENKSDEITFRVNLISTPEKIPLNSVLFEGLGEIEEFVASSAYSYIAGSTNDYNEILALHEKAVINFPNAEIIAFKNGRLIKLDRAIRKMSK